MNQAKKQEVSKQELFEKVPVPKALMTLAVPTIISQLIHLVYNMVDAFFIGRTGNSYMMAAASLSLTLMLMMISFSNLFGVGGGSLVARLIGAKKEEEARRVSAFSFYGSILAAVSYSLLIGLFMDPIMRMLGASDATIGFARQYALYVVVLGALPSILMNTIAHLLRNVGYAKQASFGLSGGGILNILLDPLFMFVLLPDGMEVAGAAIATLISNVASCIYLLYAFRQATKTAPLGIRPSDAVKIGKENAKSLFAVGIPSAMLTALLDVSNVVLNALAAAHSDLVLAGIGIVMKVERVPNAINIGICQGMLPIVAYNYASGNRERMKKTIDTARLYGLSIAAVSIVMFLIFAPGFTRIFLSTGSDEQAALATLAFAAMFLRIRCLAAPLQFLNFHTSYCMQAMGNGRGTLIHSVVRQLVFYIPFMYILNALFGYVGLTFAIVAGEGCGALFALWLLKRYLKKVAKQNA